MSDVKFRATVKHVGAEVGDLPWLEEFWAVRYGDYSALQDHIEKLEANLAKAAMALKDLADCVDDGCFCSEIQMAAAMDAARTTLAELTGGKDE